MNGKKRISAIIWSVRLLLGTLIWIGILTVIEKSIWKPATFYVTAFVYIMLTFSILYNALNPKQFTRTIDQQLNQQDQFDRQWFNGNLTGFVEATYLFWLFYIQFVAFILLCRSMWFLGWQNFQTLPSLVTYWTWISYALDNFLGVITFDFAQIYGFSLSHVEHARTFWMSTLIFTFRLSITVGFIKLILLSYERIVSRNKNSS